MRKVLCKEERNNFCCVEVFKHVLIMWKSKTIITFAKTKTKKSFFRIFTKQQKIKPNVLRDYWSLFFSCHARNNFLFFSDLPHNFEF
jgi:hypothetical protein